MSPLIVAFDDAHALETASVWIPEFALTAEYKAAFHEYTIVFLTWVSCRVTGSMACLRRISSDTMIAMARSCVNTTRGVPTDVGTTATSPNSALISGVSSAYRGVLSWYRTAPEVASPPARRTESTMNSFWVMSRISAGITSGSFKSASTVIRGPSRLLYAGVGTVHLLVSGCAYPAI